MVVYCWDEWLSLMSGFFTDDTGLLFIIGWWLVYHY
jgi:hypothetical protein